MERSLVLIKPDGIERGLTGIILARLEEQGLKLRALKMLQLKKTKAKRHYAIHKDKPFFNALVDYISSSPIVAAVFEGKQAIMRIRTIMGDTDPAGAKDGTIRGDFGINIERNTVHGSDATDTANKEIYLFFKDNELVHY